MHAAVNEADLAVKLRSLVRTQQIIVVALAASVLLFSGVSVFIRAFGKNEAGQGLDVVLPALAVGAAAGAIAMSWLLPRLIVQASRKAMASGKRVNSPVDPANEQQKLLASLGPAGELCGVFQTQSILRAAILEGAAFFTCVVYMLTGNLISLGVTLLLAGAIIAKLTTPARLVEWIEGQMRLVDEEKLLAR
jgi:hypothetical protein